MAEAEKIRAFVAVHLPREIIAGIEAFQTELASRGIGEAVRWTGRDQLHLTLEFLGQIPSVDLANVLSRLEPAAAGVPSLRLEAKGCGCFPNARQPRVLWVGLEGDVDLLKGLQSSVHEKLKAWSAEESRAYHPHITLGRVREKFHQQARKVGAALEEVTAPSFGQWTVREFHLMRSQLSPNGSTYSTLGAFPLRAG